MRPVILSVRDSSAPVPSYMKRGTKQFFGLDEECDDENQCRWLDRRRRLAAKAYGRLKEDPDHPQVSDPRPRAWFQTWPWTLLSISAVGTWTLPLIDLWPFTLHTMMTDHCETAFLVFHLVLFNSLWILWSYWLHFLSHHWTLVISIKKHWIVFFLPHHNMPTTVLNCIIPGPLGPFSNQLRRKYHFIFLSLVFFYSCNTNPILVCFRITLRSLVSAEPGFGSIVFDS